MSWRILQITRLSFFSEDDCIFTYWKMFQNGGFANTLTTNGISYDDFRRGYVLIYFFLITNKNR